MILLWVFIGTIIAWALARANQSNKLFWILFTSFMVGIAGGHLYYKCKTKSNEGSVVVHPTSIIAMSGNNVTLDIFDVVSCPKLELASQENHNPPEPTKTLSKCFISKHIEPPNNKNIRICSPTLTLLETGNT